MACRNSVPVLLMSFSPTVHFKFFSSWSFFRIFFSEVLFRLPYIISSNQLPVVFPVCYSCHIFPIRVQLLHSYNLYQMSHSQFSSLLDCFPNSVPLITHVMYSNCQIPNFLLICASASPFPVFIVPSVFCLFLFGLNLSTPTPSHRRDSEPHDWSSAFDFPALSACCRFPLLPH